jgi:hypothetical protein
MEGLIFLKCRSYISFLFPRGKQVQFEIRYPKSEIRNYFGIPSELQPLRA